MRRRHSDPRPFWRSPAWPGHPPFEGIYTISALADGGVVLGVDLGRDKLYRLYRLDSDGAIIWQLAFPEFVDIVAPTPSGKGIFVCFGPFSVGFVNLDGHLDWEASVEPGLPTGERVQASASTSCNGLLPLPDGSVVVGTVLSSGEHHSADTVIQIARIRGDGRGLWSRILAADANEGNIAALVPIPDGDVEILLTTGERYASTRRAQTFWQWRISSEGRLRATSEMQRRIPDETSWLEIEALYRSGDRLVRIGMPYELDPCHFPVEEWSLDGERLLARWELAPPSGMLNEMYPWSASAEHVFHGVSGDLLVASCGFDMNFLVSVDADRSASWHRLNLDFTVKHRHIATADGKRLFLLEGSDSASVYVGSHQLGVVDLP